MGIVTDYYLEAGLEKTQDLNHYLSEMWSDSKVKSTLDSLYNFRYVEGERVESDDGELYEILEKQPIRTMINDEEFYTADKLFENPDGEPRRSYNTQTISGGQLP